MTPIIIFDNYNPSTCAVFKHLDQQFINTHYQKIKTSLSNHSSPTFFTIHECRESILILLYIYQTQPSEDSLNLMLQVLPHYALALKNCPTEGGRKLFHCSITDMQTNILQFLQNPSYQISPDSEWENMTSQIAQITLPQTHPELLIDIFCVWLQTNKPEDMDAIYCVRYIALCIYEMYKREKQVGEIISSVFCTAWVDNPLYKISHKLSLLYKLHITHCNTEIPENQEWIIHLSDLGKSILKHLFCQAPSDWQFEFLIPLLTTESKKNQELVHAILSPENTKIANNLTLILSTPVLKGHCFYVKDLKQTHVTDWITNLSLEKFEIFYQLAHHLEQEEKIKILPFLLQDPESSKNITMASALIPEKISLSEFKNIFNNPVFTQCRDIEQLYSIITAIITSTYQEEADTIQSILLQYTVQRAKQYTTLQFAQKMIPSTVSIEEVVSILEPLVFYASQCISLNNSSKNMLHAIQQFLNYMNQCQVFGIATPQLCKTMRKLMHALQLSDCIQETSLFIQNIEQILQFSSSNNSLEWNDNIVHNCISSIPIKPNTEIKSPYKAKNISSSDIPYRRSISPLHYRSLQNCYLHKNGNSSNHRGIIQATSDNTRYQLFLYHLREHPFLDYLEKYVPERISNFKQFQHILKQPFFASCRKLENIKKIMIKMISANDFDNHEHAQIHFYLLLYIVTRDPEEINLRMASCVVPFSCTFSEIDTLFLYLRSYIGIEQLHAHLTNLFHDLQQIQISIHNFIDGQDGYESMKKRINTSINIFIQNNCLKETDPLILTINNAYIAYENNSLSYRIEKLLI